ncbi:exodeoxyribonuclease III [Thermovirga lienii DSM 17291]|uniref:Exodeoxyribonuclease III n=1 Tax=Thermovirga lienii (strain ATCC BAA-1197 / DSM 17291 / Cas60314) TaxID=580340 RepID=G7V562_THELD|nr:exodeoxyribonuclease III [Thermovirga lienii DSM 17291]
MGMKKIATFNVNSVRSRLHILERWLNDTNIDILCLQETKTEDATFPSEFFHQKGFQVFYCGEKAYNGVAVASKEKPAWVSFGLGDGLLPDGRTRMVHCLFGDDLHLINLYVPQGKALDHPDYEMKLKFFDRLLKYLDKNFTPESKIIVVGDLNVAPTDMDVTNPDNKRNHVCFHEDVKKAFNSLLEWGFVDVFRKHRPGEGEFSFWDYRVKNALERNIGWRIDHLLATKPVAERSKDAYVARELRAWEKPSDHAPVVGKFEL